MIPANELVIRLSWTENRDPTQEVPYNHCEAMTPFGRFLLTWKGWKDTGDEGFGFEESPFGIWYENWATANEAKTAAEEKIKSAILEMLDKPAFPQQTLTDRDADLRRRLELLFDNAIINVRRQLIALDAVVQNSGNNVRRQLIALDAVVQNSGNHVRRQSIALDAAVQNSGKSSQP